MITAIPASQDTSRRIYSNFWTCRLCIDNDSPQTRTYAGLLLDDEFMEAYEHGIVVKCADGVIR